MRSKQIVFANNKGGVGKTTLAYNVASLFASQGYKTVLVDLDPQCNLSLHALGPQYYEDHLFFGNLKTIYNVIKGVAEGGSDIDTSVPFVPLKENLSLLLGDIRLSELEGLMTTSGSFNLAASGLQKGFHETSAIYRFLKSKGLDEKIDLFIIDTSPSLGSLNRMILLGADYFVVPLMTDLFSVQGIENLGKVLIDRKRNWNNTAKVMANDKNIAISNVLPGDPVFLGYIINSFNEYGQKPIATHHRWIDEIPQKIKSTLSENLSKNGLVELSWKQSLGNTKDYGKLVSKSQENRKAIFEFTEIEAGAFGTIENLHKAQEEFKKIADSIIQRIQKW